MPNPLCTAEALPPHQDDATIIDQILGGKTDAFEQLMKKYESLVADRVKRHVPRAAIQETVQEVFIRAYRSLGTCKNKDRFRAWLTSIAVKTSYDYLRKQYRRKETALSTLTVDHQEWLERVSAQQSQDEYERDIRQQEARDVLESALSRLSPADRMVLELVHLQELPIREAAGLLGWSSANVKVRSHRSRKKLRAIIENLMKDSREAP